MAAAASALTAATTTPSMASAASSAAPSMTATIVDAEAIAVVGRGFPASAPVAFTASSNRLSVASTTSDPSGRFAAAALIPSGLTGNVTLSATSGAAKASASVTLSAQSSRAPSAVASMSLTQDTPTTLLLSWTAPSSQGASTVLGYKVGWTELGAPNRTWDSGPPHYRLSDSPVRLTNLTPNTSYDVRVTPFNAAGDGPTTTKRLATTGSGDGDGDGGAELPVKVLGGYWQMYQGPKVSEITANAPQYNLQYAAFALSASGGQNGAVEFSPAFESAEDLHADIAASRQAGSRWLLSIGGGGNDMQLRTTENADEMTRSLIPIIDSYGFDGVDFDIECGPDCWTPDAMKSVASQLKQHYGARFVISAAPRPYEDHYRDWALQMGDLLDLFGFQFYDDPQFNDPNFLNDNITYRVDQAVQLGIPPSKLMIGCITYSRYEGGHNTVEAYANVFKNLEKQYPELRGAFVWETSLDKKDGWTFAKGMGQAVLGR